MNRLMIEGALSLSLCPLLVAQQAASPVSAPTEASKPIVLKKRTFVEVVLLETVSSATATKGQSMRMAVENDVKIDGVVAVPKGTSATDIVVRAGKAVPGKKERIRLNHVRQRESSEL
jgi:hypothetical protein